MLMKTTKMLLYTIIEIAIICKYNSPLRKQSYFISILWLNFNAITSIFSYLSLQISILFLVYQMKKIGLLVLRKIEQSGVFYLYFPIRFCCQMPHGV